LTWKHFIVGTRTGQRYHAKEMLRIFEPMLMAQVDKDHRKEWEEATNIQAGLR
jgi:hypothetical protein